jgi:hypothetical protein
LQFTWYEAGDVLASGMVAMPVLTVGTHLIKLVVSDGMAESTNGITVQVITTAQAVGRLLELCNSEASRPQPLRMTLAVALASIERGNTVAAIYQLIAFEHQVRAQVGPSNPVLAEALNQAARAILTALGRTGP